MHPSRRETLAAIAVGLTLPSTVAQAQTAPVTIRLSVPPTEQMLPLLYAIRAGFFERAGIRFEISKTGSGAASLAAVAGGANDIGLTSMLGVVLGYARGVPFTIVAPAGLWLPSSEGGLVVTNSSPLRTAKDFIGKTVSAAAVGDVNTLGMKAWMDQNGADSSTIKVVEIPQVAAPVALEQGRVDGIIVGNPAYTYALAGGRARLVANVWSAISPRFLLVCR